MTRFRHRSAWHGSSSDARFRRPALVGLIVVALALAPAAFATTVVYWGYNHTNPDNPPAQTCSSQTSGFACSGFNYWDRTQVDKQNGGWIIYGFQNCAGCYPLGLETDAEALHVVKRVDVGAGPYNRSICSYGYTHAPTPGSYMQCRALIF